MDYGWRLVWRPVRSLATWLIERASYDQRPNQNKAMRCVVAPAESNGRDRSITRASRHAWGVGFPTPTVASSLFFIAPNRTNISGDLLAGAVACLLLFRKFSLALQLVALPLADAAARIVDISSAARFSSGL
jgi:hypothetical protein